MGQRLSAIFLPGDIVCLRGNLGAGKTCLAQGICRGLGVRDEAVSPSFAIINEYPGRLAVYHIDLYRIAAPAELDQLGLDEYLYGDGVCLVEWPERLGERLPGERLDVVMAWVADQQRQITFETHGSRWQSRFTPASCLG